MSVIPVPAQTPVNPPREEEERRGGRTVRTVRIVLKRVIIPVLNVGFPTGL